MTLIIGIKCSDGIVMGADGAATFGSLGQQTIRQETKKLEVVANRVIVGVSGPIGLGQRIKAEIQGLWTDSKVKLGDQRPAEAMKIIRDALWQKHLGPEMQVAQVAAGVIGQQIALQSALAQTVICLPLNGVPCLIQFDQQGAPEEATETLPFVAIGSGQSIADPFLAFLRRLFWRNCLPTLNDGIFSTLWTLHHAIETHPSGVSDPKQIIILEKTQNHSPRNPTNQMWKPRELPKEEFDEHMDAIQAHEKHLIDYHRLVPADTEKEKIPIPVPS
jgi:20S proteasome alpha/beta subunit